MISSDLSPLLQANAITITITIALILLTRKHTYTHSLNISKGFNVNGPSFHSLTFAGANSLGHKQTKEYFRLKIFTIHIFLPFSLFLSTYFSFLLCIQRHASHDVLFAPLPFSLAALSFFGRLLLMIFSSHRNVNLGCNFILHSVEMPASKSRDILIPIRIHLLHP